MLALKDWTLRADDGRTLSCPMLKVAPGEVCALTGPNAACKVAFLDSVAGLRKARGRIALNDNVWREPPLDRDLAARLRWPAGLMPDVSVRSNLSLALVASGRQLPSTVDLRRTLRESEVPDALFDRPASQLGRVQTVSVGLAIARLRNVSLILMDDFGDDWQPTMRSRIAALLMDFVAAGRAVLVATTDRHFVTEVASLELHFGADAILAAAQVPPAAEER